MQTDPPHNIVPLKDIPPEELHKYLQLTNEEALALAAKTPEERGAWLADQLQNLRQPGVFDEILKRAEDDKERHEGGEPLPPPKVKPRQPDVPPARHQGRGHRI